MFFRRQKRIQFLQNTNTHAPQYEFFSDLHSVYQIYMVKPALHLSMYRPTFSKEHIYIVADLLAYIFLIILDKHMYKNIYCV